MSSIQRVSRTNTMPLNRHIFNASTTFGLFWLGLMQVWVTLYPGADGFPAVGISNCRCTLLSVSHATSPQTRVLCAFSWGRKLYPFIFVAYNHTNIKETAPGQILSNIEKTSPPIWHSHGNSVIVHSYCKTQWLNHISDIVMDILRVRRLWMIKKQEYDFKYFLLLFFNQRYKGSL